MALMLVVRRSVTAPQATQLFLDGVFRHHEIPDSFVSDPDLRFVSSFWHHFFRLTGT